MNVYTPTETYKACMLIGNYFKKICGEEEYEWCCGEECAEYARLVFNMMNSINISMERASHIVLDLIRENGFRRPIYDHLWDEYCRGFLAGEILGMPTEENLKKVEKAEELWDEPEAINKGDFTYGYYQEALEEVK